MPPTLKSANLRHAATLSRMLAENHDLQAQLYRELAESMEREANLIESTDADILIEIPK